MARGRGCFIHWTIYRGGSVQKKYLLHLRSKLKGNEVQSFSIFCIFKGCNNIPCTEKAAIKFKRYKGQ